METIVAAAPFIAIASGAATAGLGIVQGIQSSRAASLEKAQFEDEAQTARLAADQEEVARRRRLAMIRSENLALRGARGLALESGSARALEEENTRAAEEDIATVRMNRLAQARRAEYGAYGASLRERGGLFSGAGAFASGIGSAATSLMRYKG